VSSNNLFIPAIKNQVTGRYILNGRGEEARSRSFIDLGVEWDYIIEDDEETLYTDGPLHDAVVVLVTITHTRKHAMAVLVKIILPSFLICQNGVCQATCLICFR
jgi:thrombospondin motif-containing protein 3